MWVHGYTEHCPLLDTPLLWYKQALKVTGLMKKSQHVSSSPAKKCSRRGRFADHEPGLK